MKRAHFTLPQADKYLISVSPEGHIRKIGIDKPPENSVINKIVGGHFELVPYFTRYDGNPCIAYCHTEGKLPHVNLPPNRFAQALWEKAVGRPITEDHLVGSIAIIVGPEKFLKTL